MILQSKKRYYILLSIILFSASIYFCLSLSVLIIKKVCYVNLSKLIEKDNESQEGKERERGKN